MTHPLGAELRARQAAAATGAPADARRTLPAHCLASCAALTAHHTGAFPALAGRFPELRPVLGKMAEDHVRISGILARVEELAGELDGLAAIAASHFSVEERPITAALDRLPGTPGELLGAP